MNTTDYVNPSASHMDPKGRQRQWWLYKAEKTRQVVLSIRPALTLYPGPHCHDSNNNNNNNNRIPRRYSRFFTISSQRRELSPTRTLKWPRRNRVQITCYTSSAYHVQHVVLRATWYEGTAQLLSLTELKSHLFELYFVG